MIDLILHYAMDAFELFFLWAYFFLIACDSRYSKHRPIPLFMSAIITSPDYYRCVAWILLFFSSVFLFGNTSSFLHFAGLILIGASFYCMTMYRGAMENAGYKRHHRR